MSVDIFGSSMDDDDSKTTQPMQRYIYNLDDLENVEGFKDEGVVNAIYGYKLTDKGIYERTDLELDDFRTNISNVLIKKNEDFNNLKTEITNIINTFNLDDLKNVEGFNKDGEKGGLYCFKLTKDNKYTRSKIPIVKSEIKNKPLMFIFEDDKYIPIPAKYDWDIDIKLNSTTFSRSDGIIRIFNSGTILGSFVSLPPQGTIGSAVLMLEKEEKYCISSQDNKEARLVFHAEHPTHDEFIRNPPDGTTIIIEGRTRGKKDEKEIIPGLLIASTNVSKFNFTIVLIKENNDFRIRYVTEGIKKISRIENKSVELSTIKIHDFYYLCRVRLTTTPVSDLEIKYL